ncbi:MAG: hypothetical protein Q8Q09_24915 [Deltaproteobacteria bacterium]|nr:hypothetical protein [Deltaproteobacteria bacterium]
MNAHEIADALERIENKLDQLLAKAATSAARPATPPTTAGEIASDSDLDSARGNPEVRFVPKRWNGADFKGRRYGDCEPEFLEMLAEALDWFANRDDESGAVDKNGNPRAKWSRLDASRARGWARRLRGERGDGVGLAGARSGASTSRDTRPSTPRKPVNAHASRMDSFDGPADGDDLESIPF